MNDQHFLNIFRYIAGTTTVVMLYVVAITFIHIPKENQRFVDITLAFLLGWISSNSQYLTGSNATSKKPDQKVTTEVTPTGTTVTTETPINKPNNEV